MKPKRERRNAMSRLYVGTSEGLIVLEDEGSNWREADRLLSDKEIFSLARANETGDLWVATSDSGLFKVNARTREVEPVGEDVLPSFIRCVTVDPSNPDHVYIGGEPLTTWRSQDGGQTWEESAQLQELFKARGWKFPAPMIKPHIRYLAVDRTDPRTVYAAAQVGGFLRSQDQGATWHDLLSGVDPDIHAIAQDPNDAATLYVATGGGGFPDDPGGYPPKLPQGRPLYRSKDGGENWECISVSFPRHYGASLCAIPSTPTTIVAGTARGIPPLWNRPEGADAVIMASRDGGDSWDQLTKGLPESFTRMVEVIVTDANGRIFAGIGGDSAKFAGDKRGQIYFTNDIDGSWTAIPNELPAVLSILPERDS
jgi:photosystem II stability/assembly factor-like uncharacterized protein